MRVFGILAVVTALSAPIMWTFRTYHIVKRVKKESLSAIKNCANEQKEYSALDMALDTNLFQYMLGLPLFVVFCSKTDFSLNEMLQG